MIIKDVELTMIMNMTLRLPLKIRNLDCGKQV